MKALKISAIVIGSAVVLMIIIAAAVFILMNRPSGIASHMTSVVSSPEAAKALDTKWTNFNNTIKQAKPGTEVTLNLTQEEITSKINEELKKGIDLPEGLAVDNVSVNLVDGKLLVSADVKYSVLQGVAGMELKVETVNGTPSIVVKDIDMGMLPIPQALKDQLTSLIPGGGIVGIPDLPINMTGIQIIDGQLVVTGITK